jgi:hypothetical protein
MVLLAKGDACGEEASNAPRPCQRREAVPKQEATVSSINGRRKYDFLELSAYNWMSSGRALQKAEIGENLVMVVWKQVQERRIRGTNILLINAALF